MSLGHVFGEDCYPVFLMSFALKLFLIHMLVLRADVFLKGLRDIDIQIPLKFRGNLVLYL